MTAKVWWTSIGDVAMKLYWTIRSIPELADLDAPARRHIWKAAYKRAYRHLFFWIGLLMFALCMYIVNEINDAFFEIRGYAELIIVGASGGLGGYIFVQFAIFTMRRDLKAERDKYLAECAE